MVLSTYYPTFRVKPTNGARIFIADTEYCDLAVMFPNCIISGFTGWNYMHQEVWALGQIRLFAAHIPSEIVSGEEINGEYKYTLPSKGSVDVVIFRVNESKYFAQNTFGTECKNVEALFDLLKPNGKMLFFSEVMWEMAGKLSGKRETFFDFRTRLVKEKAISAIVSYEDKALLGNDKSSYSLLVLNKEVNKDVWIIDEKKNLSEHISSTSLDCEILLPSYYMVTRPSNGIPLSSVVILPEEEVLADFIKGKGFVLPEDAKDMLLVLSNALGESYKDANLRQKSLITVNDPNLKEEDWISFRVAKAPCILMSGKSDKLKVGYTTKVPQSGFAYMAGCCLLPKMGIDVRYVAALLFEPSVIEQILTICDGNIFQTYLSLVLDKIFVPNHDEKERLSFLSEANYEALNSLRTELEATYQEKYDAMKSDYINEVRMRKHDMRPHLRQLASSERLMLHYIEESKNLEELKKHMRSQLGYTHEALTSLSTIVDHLSNEEKFGKSELLNLDKLLEEIEINHDDGEGFAIEYDCNRESFNRAGFVLPDLIEQWEKANEQGVDMKQFIQSLTKENLPLFVEIAPVDFQRLVTNIIDNARNHGFTDNTRTDYYIGIDLSYNADREMYQIDFSNNGNPLPDGMTKEHYGIRGEKAGEHGGTGNGGYIIKSIVSHYGGDFDVLTKDGITIIRIFLPTNK